LSKYVKVTCRARSDEDVFILVEDDGQGCDYKGILDHEECGCGGSMQDLQDICESGRGMWMSEPEIIFVTTGKATVLLSRKSIYKPARQSDYS
jgi:hypothetical protein